MRAGGFPRFLAPFLAPLVLFFAVMLLLGAILTNSTPLGAVIAAAATGVLVAVLAVKHRRLATGTVVRFSADGVELSDALGFRVRLRWPDITRIDVVETQLAAPRRVGRPGGARARVGPLRSPGLVGRGSSAGASVRCRRASPAGCASAWPACPWIRPRGGPR
ncbi:hypothetical protein ACFQQB_14560 [Nonomuraea rubra]